MAYATTTDVQNGFRELSDTEIETAGYLLDEAAVIIDAYNADAADDAKRVVSCRMVRRVLGDGTDLSAFPIGATQGSISALGYSQSWTTSAAGEMYLSKLDKKLLGVSNQIGSYSPIEELVTDD
jgi:hypothetical protein